MRVLVALSGGVDSSVTACLLKEQGHEVIGVHFTLWQDPLAPALARILPTKCCTTQGIARIRSVTGHLGIPLHVVDLCDSFRSTVVDPYLAACRRGLTPNPCVECNRDFKMHHLLALARKWKCERVATGHYARTVKRQGRYALLEAKDSAKDQSYFLSRLTQKELSVTLLPLGTLTKKQVYALAKKYRIPLDRATYRESQDLCFFPEKSPSPFLHRYLRSARPGPIKTPDGTIVGTHDGLPFVTIGQRRGLDIGGQREPHYVVSKEQISNTIFVAPLRDTLQSAILIKRLSRTGDPLPKNKRIRLQVRIRSQGHKLQGTFSWDGSEGCFIPQSPVPAVTPGQVCVLYRGSAILGSGIIAPIRRQPLRAMEPKQ